MKKRIFALIVILALILTGCGNSQASKKTEEKSTNQSADKNLVLSTFGLSQDIVQKDIIDPFMKESGAKVVLEVGNASERYTKLANNPNSNIDVIELSQSLASKGAKEGVFVPLTEKEVPNIANLTDGAKEVLKSGAGVPTAVNSIGIIYNKAKLGRDITSWDDLWSADLKGKVAIPDITTTAGPLMLYVAADHVKSDITKDSKPAFEALQQLKPNVVKTYTKSSDLANMFQSGEIEVAVVADFAVSIVQKASADAVYVVPASGTYANYNTINVSKNSAHKELAYQFINHRISEASQRAKAAATSLREAPVNKQVVLTEDEAKNMTYGAVAQRAKTIDFKYVNDNLKQWIEQFNSIMNK